MDIDAAADPSAPFRFPHTCTLFLPSAAIAPKICRDFVGGVLHLVGLGHLADRAALCTSELVTNVHRYADGLVHLQCTAERTRVRVCVYDSSPARPRPRRAGADEQGGRGLALVGELADGWGVTESRLGLPVKGVWFELGTARTTGRRGDAGRAGARSACPPSEDQGSRGVGETSVADRWGEGGGACRKTGLGL